MSGGRVAAIVLGVVAALVVVFLALAVGAYVVLRATSAPDPAPAPPSAAPWPEPPGLDDPEETAETVSVTYEVTGTGPARVSYTTADGNAVGGESVTLPWRVSFDMVAEVYEVRLGAVTSGAPPKGFGCILTVDGERVTDSEPNDVGAVSCEVSL
jgi:hypothetical protein